MLINIELYCGPVTAEASEGRVLLNAIRNYRAELQAEPLTPLVWEELTALSRIQDDVIGGLLNATTRLDSYRHEDGYEYFRAIDEAPELPFGPLSPDQD
jgi:hypothetical protein